MAGSNLPFVPAGAAPPVTPHASLQQAAEWFALLRSGEATEQDRAAWKTWLDGARAHHEAWQYVESIGRRFEPVQDTQHRDTALAALQSVRRRSPPRRQLIGGLAALGGAGLLGWLAWRHTGLQETVAAWGASHRTATGEVRDVLLADGSRIWLNTASAIDVDFGADLRRVRLLAGEVLVQTAHDATRPFVVDTAQGRLRALGTRFTVRQQGDNSFVGVYEGAVEIRPADSADHPVVAAGEQRRFTSTGVLAAEPVERAREAWARGVLLAEDIPLRDLVRELRRYRPGHLGVADAVAGLRVIGAYPLHEPDRVLAMLEEVLPVRVQRTLPWWTSLEPRPPAR